MTSKKELRAQLAEAAKSAIALRAELAEHVRANDRLRASNGEHERRELSREAREREAEQAERREAEHKARRERLDRLGEGLLPVEGATSRAFIEERNGESGIEVFVPLDAEERRILQGFFDARDQPKPPQVDKSVFDQINDAVRRMAQHHTIPQVFLAGQL